jgi:single-stranded DNA-binding protein
MPTRVTKEIVAITGKYTDTKGQEKNRYTKIGVLMEKDNGSLMIKMETIPLNWDGFAYLNDPRENKGDQGGGSASPQQRQPQQQSRPQSNFDDLDDDIPF